MPEKVAVLWVHFGPYHLARLRALKRRCEVTAIEFAPGQQKYGWRSEGNPEVHTLSHAVHEEMGILRNVARLWRLLNEVDPAYLFIPGYREPLAITAALWGKVHGRTNVLMSDSTALDLVRNPWREKLKAEIVARFFQKAFVSGRKSGLYLQSISDIPYEVGYDAVDNSYFANRVKEIRSKDGDGRLFGPFLFVGRLAAVKNIPLLLDAFGNYKRKGGKRKLVVVGHGPLESSLKAAVALAGLEEPIQFVGFQSYERLPNWYARAACLILPSWSEPWGLVVNEAMASGLPVIVSDRCGCADDLVENGRNGYIFSAENPELLTERMLAIDTLCDKDLIAMGSRSEEIIERFSVEVWADTVLRMVDETPEGLAVA